MSTPNENDGQEKKLAVGLNPYRHTQLTWIAQLRSSTMNAEFLKAIDAHIEAAKSDPQLIAKADEVRAAIAREAQAQQAALANLFAGSVQEEGTGSGDTAAVTPIRRGRKGAEQSDS